MSADDAMAAQLGTLSQVMCDELQIRPAVKEDLGDLLDLYFHLDPQDDRCPAEIAPKIFDKFRHTQGSG